jgi:hypothetical protein
MMIKIPASERLGMINRYKNSSLQHCQELQSPLAWGVSSSLTVAVLKPVYSVWEGHSLL